MLRACFLLLALMAAALPLLVRGTDVRLSGGAATIESNFPAAVDAANAAAAAHSQARGYPTRLLTPLKVSVHTSLAPVISQAGAAFKATDSSFSALYTVGATNEEAKDEFFAGGYDFLVATFAPTRADYQRMPSLGAYPVQAVGVVFTYNLPPEVSNGQTLALSESTLCRIWRGNITRWDDESIVAENPTMALAGITSPAANKKLLIFDQFVANTAHDPLVRYCHKVDPEFAALIPIANPPVYPAGVIAASYATVDALNSAVADTSFSFAMTVLSNAVQIRLPIGAMINRNGAHILPTANAMWLNLYELGTDGYDAVNVGDYDLTNPSTAQAWPLLSMSWLILDKTGAVSTCANKKMVLNFLTFFYTDGVVDKIAASLSTSSFPLLYVDQLGLIDQLRQELTCLGSRIYTSDTSKSILAVNALVAPAMTLLSSFYTSIDTSVVYTNAHAPERLAVQRVALGEQDMALVNGAALSDEDVAVLAEGHTKLIPGFLAGVVPIFTLPFALTSFYALPATADLGLPPLYPLRLDLELAARLFIGEVSSWLDADLVALNPQLPVWFTHSGADPTLQLIVGATAVDDPLSGAKLLFQHFRHTKLASDPAYAYAFTSSAAVDGPQSNPFLSIIKHVTTSSNVTEGYHANITLIESESRLAIKSAQVGGSVSYKHLESLANPLSEFFFVSPLPEGADPVTAERTVIDSSVASMAQCGTRLTSPPGSEHWSADEMQAHLDTLALPSAQRAWVDGSEAKCWPLSTLLSFAVKTEYSDSVVPGSCAQSLHSLEFINYIQSTTILSLPVSELGFTRLADSDMITRLSQQLLRSASCDGQAILVILPLFWQVSSSLRSFGQAIGILGLLLVVASAAVVLSFRHKVVIRSASAPFLLAILLGMGLLIAAAIPWAAEPTRSSCAAFLWLADIGFMLLFCPLFAKTWRVYRIFSGSHLKVVKISNVKLLMATAVVLLLDLILIAAWQGMSPLIPVEYDRVIGSEQHVFTHCSVQSSGSGLIFVSLVGVEKAALLLFGAIMAFSTRNVKGTFNESTQISWTIYNTLLSALIGVVIIVFVSAVEDALIILVLLMLLWIVFTAWGLIFAPKIYMLFLSDEKLIEQSRSQIQQETSNGFSFASIAAMTSGQVKHFYVALKIQLNKAESVLGLPLTIFDKDAAATGKKNSNGPQHSGGSDLAWGNTNKASPIGPTNVEKGNNSALRQRRTAGGTAAATVLKKIETEDDTFDAAASYRMDIQPAAMAAAKERDDERERGVLLARSDSSSSTSSISQLQQQQQQQSARVGAAGSATSPHHRQPLASPSSTTHQFEYPTARGSTAGDPSRANMSDIPINDPPHAAADGDASPSSSASRTLRAPTMTDSASSSFVATGAGMTASINNNNNHGSLSPHSRRPSNPTSSGSLVSRVPAAVSAAGTIGGGNGMAAANKHPPSATACSPSSASSSLGRVHYSSALLQAHTTAVVSPPPIAVSPSAVQASSPPASAVVAVPSAAATAAATGSSGSNARGSPPSSPS